MQRGGKNLCGGQGGKCVQSSSDFHPELVSCHRPDINLCFFINLSHTPPTLTIKQTLGADNMESENSENDCIWCKITGFGSQHHLANQISSICRFCSRQGSFQDVATTRAGGQKGKLAVCTDVLTHGYLFPNSSLVPFSPLCCLCPLFPSFSLIFCLLSLLSPNSLFSLTSAQVSNVI